MDVIFKQPCLIKKNTKAIRTKLEKLGYKYTALVSDNENYNNTKEPWIFCAYDMYTCVDGPSYESLRKIVCNPDNFMPMEGLSHDVIVFDPTQENEFWESASATL